MQSHHGFTVVAAVVIVGLLVLVGGLGFYVGKYPFVRMPVSVRDQVSRTIAPASSPSCNLNPPAQYALAQLTPGIPASFTTNLQGNGRQELVEIYNQDIGDAGGGRSLPIITKVYDLNRNCSQAFQFTGKEDSTANRSGNELLRATLLPNFQGDKKDAVLVINESTAYGSGYTAYMHFLVYRDGAYQVIPGPTLSELSRYNFSGQSLGDTIVVGTAVWDQNEAHFVDHRYQFTEYMWDGSKYGGISFGVTRKKYSFSTPIGVIFTAEPLTPQKPQ